MPDIKNPHVSLDQEDTEFPRGVDRHRVSGKSKLVVSASDVVVPTHRGRA